MLLSNGVPIPHPYESQRAGENDPLLLQDFQLIDLLSRFDRERIPERVAHAKGSGAHGCFECTNPIPELQPPIFSVQRERNVRSLSASLLSVASPDLTI
jgi:catalase